MIEYTVTVPQRAATVLVPSPVTYVTVSRPGSRGPQGQPGPQGPAGDGGFTFTQTTPAATWTITNTLGRYPSAVTVVVGDEVVDADIETPDVNTVVITFASPQSGRAELI